MSAFIIFFSTGLLIYWTSRTTVLLHTSEDEISRVLDRDLSRANAFLAGLRAMFLLTAVEAG